MFGKKGSSAAGSMLVVLLMGLALVLCVPQAAFAAEQAAGRGAAASLAARDTGPLTVPAPSSRCSDGCRHSARAPGPSTASTAR